MFLVGSGIRTFDEFMKDVNGICDAFDDCWFLVSEMINRDLNQILLGFGQMNLYVQFDDGIVMFTRVKKDPNGYIIFDPDSACQSIEKIRQHFSMDFEMTRLLAKKILGGKNEGRT